MDNACFRAVLLSILMSVFALPVAAQSRDDLAAIIEAWLDSPHGDHGSLSFTYWNEAGAVPENCAACHSEPGFIDFLGADGSEPGVVNHPAPINAVIGCASCHTSAAHALDTTTLPSGLSIHGLGDNATCSVCHAGRTSGQQVLAATSAFEDDAVTPSLGFINVHYGVAAAVMQGGEGRSGYEYPGRTYVGRFRHVEGADTCVACHDAHTTRVETEGCLTCHRGVESVRDIRSRHGDFDGDGDNSGGIHTEIEGLHAQLLAAIQVYAAEVGGAPVGYATGRFPYFFADADADGAISDTEAVAANRYTAWTPRMLRAAFNYQFVAQDPGGYVHNPTYLLQLLYDSLENLSEQIDVDLGTLRRP